MGIEPGRYPYVDSLHSLAILLQLGPRMKYVQSYLTFAKWPKRGVCLNILSVL